MAAPRRALIVVDVQQEYFDGILQIQHPNRDDTRAQIVRAVDVAQAQGLPVVIVQHEYPEGSPVFARDTASWKLIPELEGRDGDSWKRVTKNKASVFAGTDVAEWLAEREVDTITIVGYMTNNCVLGTAAAAEDLDLAAEVLSDATGAIHLANGAGKVSAEQVHETLLVLLQSNFAAVASAKAWSDAVVAGEALPKSDLGTSALQGRAVFAG